MKGCQLADLHPVQEVSQKPSLKNYERKIVAPNAPHVRC